MSLLKTNEIQNYNGSSLTLTASTVSTSAQLNTGGNISVTGSLNVSDDSTTRTNLGLGSIATQAADSVSISGGNITGGTIGSGVVFPALPADKGASLQLILTQSFSSVSSVAFEDVFSSGFRNYKLIGEVSGLSGELRFRFFTSGTTEFTTSVYTFVGVGRDNSPTDRNNQESNTSFWQLEHTTADQACFDYTIYKPYLTSDTFYSGTNLTERTAGSLYITMVQGGSVDSGTSFTGCNVYPDAGTVSGNISIYGIKE